MNSKFVGPVLNKSDISNAIIKAIKQNNNTVLVIDRGAYLRVKSQNICRLPCHLVSKFLGRPFHSSLDLESVMLSFAGKLQISDEEIVWVSNAS